jgi:nitroimidazol reductase NimA-like FMN-containing flavoprotein (pyridoxamine 5'-phosphate oxidase superfamily)
MATDFPITERTRMRRKAKRATYDRAAIHAILDEALIAFVAVVIDGKPQVQPMIHCRIGDALILHGLASNRLLSHIAAGGEACINVAIIDALALARRIEDHSMHYRSATVYGRGTLVDDESEKHRLMVQVFASLVGSGRFDTLPPLPAGYLKGTMVVRVPIDEAVGKVNDQVDTAEGPEGLWSGLLPVNTRFGPPMSDNRTVNEGTATPARLDSYRRGQR